jgi:adenine/guanine phosphoribosyltransferase-like PRPP-binding protein
MKNYLRQIDVATNGNRYDVTPVFKDAESFGQLVEGLAAPFMDTQVDCVACIDADLNRSIKSHASL